MSVKYHRMCEGQEAAVSDLIHGLFIEYGKPLETKLSAEAIRENGDILRVEIAEADGKVIGFCAWMMSFSTWRGVKGIYVADLFSTPGTHHSEVCRNLLLLAAKNGAAQGAAFIRTEVDISDEASEILFSEVGFWNQTRHVMYFLEPAEFRKFTSANAAE